MVITKQFTIYPVGDEEEVKRVYEYLRNGQETEAQMKNMYISALYAARMTGATKEELKELRSRYQRVPNSKLGSAYTDVIDEAKYPVGLPLAGCIPRLVQTAFDEAAKKGLLHGVCSLPSFRKDGPLDIPKMYIMPKGTHIIKDAKGKERTTDTGLYYDKKKYPSPMDFHDALFKERNVELFLKFANDITFSVIFGNMKKSMGLRKAIEGIYSGEITCCDSKIQVVKTKIFLKMSLNYPERNHELDKGTVMGVDIGAIVPVMCALNNNEYVRLSIGSGKYLNSKRVMFQKERKRLAKSLRDSSSAGRGRKDKLKPLERLKSKEANFDKNYNHIISRRTVEFAVAKGAGVIQLENLSGISRKARENFVLRNWIYNDLQEKIEYKAAQAGIEVRYIEPAYTSQVCSICGHKGDYINNEMFICTNPECRIHGKYKEAKGKKYDANGDFNAARNIAMSTHFTLKSSHNAKLTPGQIKDDCLEGLLTEGTTYPYSYVCEDTAAIMCDDGYWHEFALSKLETELKDENRSKRKDNYKN